MSDIGTKHKPFFRRDRAPGRNRQFEPSKKPRRPRVLGRASPRVVLKATVDKNHKGFAFLVFENRRYEDVFLPPREAQLLFHGDRVQVEMDPRGQVTEVEVLEHRFRELVGRYSPQATARGEAFQRGWVVYDRKKTREEIYVPRLAQQIRAGDWVRAKLNFHKMGPYPVTAEIVEVYGRELPASADIDMVAAEYNLIEQHSKSAEKEARDCKLEIPGKDLEGREDLRHIPFITVDSETARDFDDAIYVERKKAGYVLWVAIADVSHYVTEGRALDQEGRSRGTTVYFPERAFHMLPRALSENLCSLKPHEPRLALVSRLEISRHGKVQGTEIIESVVQSHRRATYSQIQAEWEQNQKKKDWEFTPHFELYLLLKKQRKERGSIDFEFPEAEMNVEPSGEVISIRQRSRLDSHRLIEEFMIAANEAVTEWIMKKHWPFVYRIHDEPKPEFLQSFQKLAANVGVHFKIDPSGEKANSSKLIADLVRRLEGHPAQDLLNMTLLRSMKRAIYSAVHGRHYGLASEGYTHFTSPIRRYPDLVVHRLLRHALRVGSRKAHSLNESTRSQLEKDLEEICENCSYRERLSADAEREATKLKQVRAMTEQLGKEFEGQVVGIVDAGIFVAILDPYCEGLVSRESMADDYYKFDEKRMVFRGYRTRRQIKIGDKLAVRCLKADIDRRVIDFGLVDVAAISLPSRKQKDNVIAWKNKK